MSHTIAIPNPTPEVSFGEPCAGVDHLAANAEPGGKTSSQETSRGIKFFALPNLSSQHVTDTLDPRTLAPVDYPADKEEFRAWCSNPKTKHLFFNHTEGLTPANRITVSNEAFRLWGFTADFDSKQTEAEIISIVTRNAAEGLMPAYYSVSFSGNARLTWDFEEPVLVDQPALAERFLYQLGKELKLKNLLAGLDPASFKLGQYYEAGRHWTAFPDSRPISSRLLATLFYRAADQVKFKTQGPVIPIESVAAEVEKRWPGRVDNFEVGARLPLFWVEPFEDRVGAQVGDHGMICYSTRAVKSFTPWIDILGAAFVRDFQAERIGAAAEDLYFDGRHYWRRDEGGVWRCRNTEDMIRWLKTQGINPRPEAKSYASEADRVLITAQEAREVKAAAPIVHDIRQIVIINGEKYLNVSAIEVMKPGDNGDPVNWPWLHEFFWNIWAEPQKEQREHFLAWLQYFYVPCLEGRPTQGQAIVIAGEPSRGKTFMNHHILGKMMGGWSDPTEYLMGRTNFNRENAETALWSCDDQRGAVSWGASRSSPRNSRNTSRILKCAAKAKERTLSQFLGKAAS